MLHAPLKSCTLLFNGKVQVVKYKKGKAIMAELIHMHIQYCGLICSACAFSALTLLVRWQPAGKKLSGGMLVGYL